MPDRAKPDGVMTELAESLTESIEEASAGEIAKAFDIERTEADGLNTTHTRENRSVDAGSERRTVSDLGFIGWIIAQLAQD
jgi:hypothetical protein